MRPLLCSVRATQIVMPMLIARYVTYPQKRYMVSSLNMFLNMFKLRILRQTEHVKQNIEHVQKLPTAFRALIGLLKSLIDTRTRSREEKQLRTSCLRAFAQE